MHCSTRKYDFFHLFQVTDSKPKPIPAVDVTPSTPDTKAKNAKVQDAETNKEKQDEKPAPVVTATPSTSDTSTAADVKEEKKEGSKGNVPSNSIISLML